MCNFVYFVIFYQSNEPNKIVHINFDISDFMSKRLLVRAVVKRTPINTRFYNSKPYRTIINSFLGHYTHAHEHHGCHFYNANKS